MDRRNFLYQGLQVGAFLTMPQFLASCKSYEGLDDSLHQREILNAEVKKLAPILQAISIGITAPNPHNTQAWKFLIHDELSMSLYADEKRLLMETDPTTRQIHLGQGSFIELFCIGAKEIGYDVKIELLPEGENLLMDVGKKPIAYLQLKANQSINKDVIYTSVAKRAINRSNYEGDLLTQFELETIQSICQLHYSTFHYSNIESEMQTIQNSILEAINIETNSLAKNDESRFWFRYNDDEIFTKKDGISLRGNGLSGIKYWMARNFFLRKGKTAWNSESGRKQSIAAMEKPLMTAKAFAFLKTATNTQKDWINAGRDFARLHLGVTQAGFVLHPYSQILQEYPEMKQAQQKFNDHLNIREPEKIQMLFRLGRSDYKFFSPRRSISDMVIKDV